MTVNGIVRDQTYKQEVARSSRAPPIHTIPRLTPDWARGSSDPVSAAAPIASSRRIATEPEALCDGCIQRIIRRVGLPGESIPIVVEPVELPRPAQVPVPASPEPSRPDAVPDGEPVPT